ncbi:MAG TPA: DUF6498-containing protein [Candidatus Paceibacterota bacterium]
MSTIDQPKKNLFYDFSFWTLLFSNLITIFFATRDGWSLSTIMLIYWFQSVIIGLFNFIRILQLTEFSTNGLIINDSPAQPTKRTKIFIAFFFLAHYGLFHVAYLAFILSGSADGLLNGKTDAIDVRLLVLTVILFFANHLFSFIYNRPRDTKKQNIGSLMFHPYIRIIPMHITIVAGSIFASAMLPFFLILKTFSDVLMHIVEHRIIRRGQEDI